MEKPKSLSIKDWIIRNMSVRDGIQERVIEMVVNDAFEGASRALKECEGVEISGFGRFYFKKKGAKKRLEGLYDMKAILEAWAEGTCIEKRERAKSRMPDLLNGIGILKHKLHEDIGDL